MKKSAGITLAETAVTVAIVGIVSLSMARVNQQLTSVNTHSQATQLMMYDANIVLTQMALKIKSAGAGLRGMGTVDTGRSVIAAPDNPLANFSPELIFISRDNAPQGSLGAEDIWIRYSLATDRGRTGVLERTYQTDNWLDIKDGSAPVIESRFFKMQDGVTLEGIDFTMYDSQMPPRISNQDPDASSVVRVAVRLAKAGVKTEEETLITLENMLYAPN